MKKNVIIISGIATVMLVFMLLNSGTFADYYYNRDHKKLWNELRTALLEERVSKVELNSDKSIELTGEDKDDFIDSLRKAQFDRSNWRKEGPTGPIIAVIFNDDSTQHFQYWGGTTFETTYKSGQFLISSRELAEILNKYNISP